MKEKVEQAHKPGVLQTTGVLLVVLVLSTAGLLDYVTGPWVSFALLYVTPVLAASWWLGRGPAIFAGVWAGALWFIAEAWGHRGEPTGTLAWNSLTRLLMLLAMALMVGRIREDRRRLKRANARLSELLSEAEKLARTDPLTGLPNRRAFLERLAEEVPRARRNRAPLCIAYVDVDNFKDLNDRDGHESGDAFLREIAHAIRETVRQADVAARLGGDEFAILFVDAKRVALEPLAQRLMARLHALGERHHGLDLGASIGMAFFDEPPERPELLLQRADAAMYRAKAAGKHRFAFWASGAAAPELQA